MLRFASLGSGSRGNATLVESAGQRILVDCGFALRTLESRLALLGVQARDLDALLITHEHTDHVRGLGPLLKRYPLPAWMSAGTAACLDLPPASRIFHLDAHSGPLQFADLEVLPFPVPHDAREPIQYRFSSAGHSLGILTDLGVITPHIPDLLHRCDALILECNHDEQWLADGDYPPSLKARVASGYGHLSNRQAMDFLSSLAPGRLQRLLLAHLSERNNSPARVRQTLAQAADLPIPQPAVLTQDQVSPWFQVG